MATKKAAAKKKAPAKKKAAAKKAPARKKVAAKKAAPAKKVTAMKAKMTKSQIVASLADSTDLSKKQVNAVLDELNTLIERSINPIRFVGAAQNRQQGLPELERARHHHDADARQAPGRREVRRAGISSLWARRTAPGSTP